MMPLHPSESSTSSLEVEEFSSYIIGDPLEPLSIGLTASEFDNDETFCALPQKTAALELFSSSRTPCQACLEGDNHSTFLVSNTLDCPLHPITDDWLGTPEVNDTLSITSLSSNFSTPSQTAGELPLDDIILLPDLESEPFTSGAASSLELTADISTPPLNETRPLDSSPLLTSQTIHHSDNRPATPALESLNPPPKVQFKVDSHMPSSPSPRPTPCPALPAPGVPLKRKRGRPPKSSQRAQVVVTSASLFTKTSPPSRKRKTREFDYDEDTSSAHSDAEYFPPTSQQKRTKGSSSKQETSNEPVRCPVPKCGVTFGRRADLGRHFKYLHLPKPEPCLEIRQADKNSVVCPACGTVLSRPDARKRHEEKCEYYIAIFGVTERVTPTTRPKKRRCTSGCKE